MAYGQAISAAFLFSATQIHDLVNNPEVKEALGALALPKWFPMVLLGLAIATYVAHGHKED